MGMMGSTRSPSDTRPVFVAGRERRARFVRLAGSVLAALFVAYLCALALSLAGAIDLHVPGLPPMPSPRPPSLQAQAPPPRGAGTATASSTTAPAGATRSPVPGTTIYRYQGTPVTAQTKSTATTIASSPASPTTAAATTTTLPSNRTAHSPPTSAPSSGPPSSLPSK